MIFLLIAVIICVGDIVIKHHIETHRNYNQESKLFQGRIIVTRQHNKGAFLNLLEKNKSVVVTISSILLGIILLIFGCLIPKKGHVVAKLGLSFLVGGACSNVYDRIKRGYVVDYFSFRWLKKVVFNLSDIFIFIGAFLLAVLTLIKKK